MQEEVAPQLEPGMIPSTVDPDAAAFGEKGNKVPKRSVRISAWKLAKLDSSEAVRAAAKARASSSVLRPVDNRRLPDAEMSSSGNMSVRSSMSTDTGGNKDNRNELRPSPLANSIAPSQGSRDEYETGTQSVSSFSSPSHVHESVTLSPIPQAHGLGQVNTSSSVLDLGPKLPLVPRAAFPRMTDPTPHPSSGFDGKITQKVRASDPLLLPPTVPATSLLHDIKRTLVVWDQEAGRYVSVAVSASEARSRSFLPGGSNANAGLGNNDKRPAADVQEPSQAAAKLPTQQSENLLYAGDSIFFGGPLLSGPLRDNLKNERGLGTRDGQDRLPFIMSKDSRFKRDSASNQLPVFIPGDFPSGSGMK